MRFCHICYIIPFDVIPLSVISTCIISQFIIILQLPNPKQLVMIIFQNLLASTCFSYFLSQPLPAAQWGKKGINNIKIAGQKTCSILSNISIDPMDVSNHPKQASVHFLIILYVRLCAHYLKGTIQVKLFGLFSFHLFKHLKECIFL